MPFWSQKPQENQVDRLRAIASSAAAFRPPSPQSSTDAVSSQPFAEQHRYFLDTITETLPGFFTETEATRLAAEALSIVDSQQIRGFAHDPNRVMVIWHVYIADALKRPDLTDPGSGSLSPAGAVLTMAVKCWRPELLGLWAEQSDGAQ